MQKRARERDREDVSERNRENVFVRKRKSKREKEQETQKMSLYAMHSLRFIGVKQKNPIFPLKRLTSPPNKPSISAKEHSIFCTPRTPLESTPQSV